MSEEAAPATTAADETKLTIAWWRAANYLTVALGAAFDNPDLLVACVIGDGVAETGPLEASWKGTRFLNPARDGAVLPILNLNENKISGPTVLGRAARSETADHASPPAVRLELLFGLLRHGVDPARKLTPTSTYSKKNNCQTRM
jgi:hypothetical protein